MTEYDLYDALERDLDWRSQELNTFRRILLRASREETPALRRAFVPLIMAHAEGFVRTGLRAYVRFVSSQGVKGHEIASCHLAWGLSEHFNRFRSGRIHQDFAAPLASVNSSKGRRHELEILFLDSLRELFELEIRLDDSRLDRFEHNLTSEFLIGLFVECGLNVEDLPHWIGDLNGLVVRRNEIAHGESSDPREAEIERWERLLLNLFKVVRDEIFEAAISRRFQVRVAN